MNKDIEITFEVNEEHYIEFNYNHLMNSIPSQKFMLKFYSVIFGLIPLTIFTTFFDGILALIFGIASFILVFMWSPKIFKKLINNNIKQQLNLYNNDVMFTKRNLKIEGTQFTVWCDKHKEIYDASSIKGVVMYNEVLTIYLSSIHINVIPTTELTKEEVDILLSYNPEQKLFKF